MSLEIIITPDKNLPIVTSPVPSGQALPLLSLISEHHEEILKQLNQYGIILFRGFSCQDEVYFSKAIEFCRLGRRCDTSDYDLPRTVLQNDVYTSSDLPGHLALPLHHEKPRTLKPPNYIYFCCVTPASLGGGTVFANAESIWLDMPEAIKNKIQEYGVVYKQFLHGKTMRYSWLKSLLGKRCARAWGDYFGTDDKSQIEQKLLQDKVSWQWVNRNKNLILSTYLPGQLTHPMTQRINWFNSAAYLNYYANFFYGALKRLPLSKYLTVRNMIFNDMLPMVCHYGNGQAFTAAEVEEINQVINAHTWVLNWQQGDFMIVDNYTYMHGKQPHQGKRLLYSCMTEITNSY